MMKECMTCKKLLPYDSFGKYMNCGKRRRHCNECWPEVKETMTTQGKMSRVAMRQAALPEFQRLWARGLAQIFTPTCCVCGAEKLQDGGERIAQGLVCWSCIRVEARRGKV